MECRGLIVRRSAISVAASVVLTVPTFAQQASPCRSDDIGITVCPEGKIEKRIIVDTKSPKNSYGIAWKTDEGRTGKDYELFAGPPQTRYAGGDTDTFLVRLTDGKTLGKLKAVHPGDKPRYNHQSQHVAWSPDETWLIGLNDSKWRTDNADAYHVGDSGISEPLDLLPICKAAERRHFKSAGRKVGIERFEQTVSIKSIGNDGTVQMLCHMEIMRGEERYRFAVPLKLAVSGKTASAKLGPIKRCKADQETGPCAFVEYDD
jgi:hypothetical protein